MGYCTISSETIGNIMIIKLLQPQSQNKLDLDNMAEMVEALNIADGERNCRAVILTSEGEYFCGGGNLGDFRTKSSIEIRQFGEALKKLHRTVCNLSKPVIAAVQGHAFGGGFSLLEACDLAIAADTATFAIPESNSGLAPMVALVGAMETLTRKKAMEMALLGKILTAEEALSLGVVNRVSNGTELLEAALAVATDISERNPAALSVCKRLYNSARSLSYEQKLEAGVGSLIEMLKSEDAKEVYEARLDNRNPGWKNL